MNFLVAYTDKLHMQLQVYSMQTMTNNTYVHVDGAYSRVDDIKVRTDSFDLDVFKGLFDLIRWEGSSEKTRDCVLERCER